MQTLMNALLTPTTAMKMLNASTPMEVSIACARRDTPGTALLALVSISTIESRVVEPLQCNNFRLEFLCTFAAVCSGQTTVSLAGKEYHIVTDEKVDWYNANTRCTQWAQDNGATPGALASILNSQTQICFTEMLTYNENDWSDEDLYHRGVWIGGNDVSIEDSWRWQDGTPMPSSSNVSDY